VRLHKTRDRIGYVRYKAKKYREQLRMLRPSISAGGLSNFTGQKANSLKDFLEKIQKIEAESLEFHLLRKDFESWIELTIGNPELTRSIGLLRVQKLTGNDLRNNILLVVLKRITDLSSTSNLLGNKKLVKKTMGRRRI